MVLIMPEMTPQEVKDSLKVALKEWLDDKFAELGKWSLGGIAVAVLGLLAYGLIITGGFHR